MRLTIAKKRIMCMECEELAVKGIKEMNVGVCKKHADELLVAAILQRIVNKANNEHQAISKVDTTAQV